MPTPLTPEGVVTVLAGLGIATEEAFASLMSGNALVMELRQKDAQIAQLETAKAAAQAEVDAQLATARAERAALQQQVDQALGG